MGACSRGKKVGDLSPLPMKTEKVEFIWWHAGATPD